MASYALSWAFPTGANCSKYMCVPHACRKNSYKSMTVHFGLCQILLRGSSANYSSGVCERLLPTPCGQGILAHFSLYLSHNRMMTRPLFSPLPLTVSPPSPFLLLLHTLPFCIWRTRSHQVAHIGLLCGKPAASISAVNRHTWLVSFSDREVSALLGMCLTFIFHFLQNVHL